MDIGKAIELLRIGNKVTREGWNGKDMWLELQTPDTHSKMTLPYIYLNTPYPQPGQVFVDGQRDRVPWLASQTDILASDWALQAG